MPAKSGNPELNYIKGKLDVNIISKNTKFNDNDEEKYNFDSKVLLNNIYERRKRLHKWMIKMFNLCCEKIKTADDLGLTDIVFEIPKVIVESSEFKHEQAIKYIDENLKKEFLDTYILSYRQIFISWKYIELNRENNLESSHI